MEKVSVIFNGKEIVVSINDKINRLTILDIWKEHGVYFVSCKCDCNNIVEKVVLRSLLSGNTKSCGCLNKELRQQRNFKHGFKTRDSHMRLYNTWSDMRRRCNNPNRKRAKSYYYKGIQVCDEWNNFENFYEWAINNGYDDSLTLERIDNNLNYCPENCKWIPKSEQSKNRTSNHYITYNNETKTLTDWAETLGINRTTLSSRLRRGWSIEEAFQPNKQD